MGYIYFDYIPLFVFISVASMVIGVILFVVVFEKKRTKMLRDFAFRRGYQFEENTVKTRLWQWQKGHFGQNIPHKMLGFRLFLKGHSKRMFNIMKKASGTKKMWVFDYNYTIGGGKYSRTYKQTVARLSGFMNLPAFTLGPETFFHKIGKVFGTRDINFEHNPTFSNKYLLKGNDESAIRKFFTADKLQSISRITKPINIECMGKEMIFFRLGKRVKINEFGTFLDEVQVIQSLFSG